MIKVYYAPIGENIRCDGSDAARKLLGYALARDHGIECAAVSKDENGKPYLYGHPNVHISITHTTTVVAVCISDHPVGIDAETVGEIRTRVAERLFTSYEREYIGDDPVRFFRVWTGKESFAKLTGEGITRRLAEIDVLSGENTGGAVFIPIDIDETAACVCTFAEDEVTAEKIVNVI